MIMEHLLDSMNGKQPRERDQNLPGDSVNHHSWMLEEDELLTEPHVNESPQCFLRSGLSETGLR
jgi:hypothetical protein